MSSVDPTRNGRPALLERYGRFYGEQHFAVAWTATNDPERGDPKRVLTQGWDKAKPLADGDFGAGLFPTRGKTKNPTLVLRPSNLVGVECDTGEDLERIERLGLPKTITVVSSLPFKRHFWFRPPMTLEVLPFVAFRFESGKLSKDAGRYLLLPPALHPSGAVYSFLPGHGPDEVEIAEMPEDVYHMLCGQARQEDAELRERIQVDPEAKIRAGNRRDYLYRYGCMLRRWGLNRDELAAAVYAYNEARCDPPVEHHLIDVQIDGAMKHQGGEELARVPRVAPRLPGEDAAVCGHDVDTAELLEAVVNVVHRYIVVGRVEADAVALWVAHTHVLEAAETSPYLAVCSAEKRSAKTLLLDVLELLVAKPWRAITPSEAVLFRKIAESRPTLLLDEYDAVFHTRRDPTTEGLRAILNAGNRVGTTVPRCVGEGARMSVRDFSVYGAKALAGLGDLPDTVRDRAIVLHMRRRAPGEQVERFRRREAVSVTTELRANLQHWAENTVDLLAEARPELPDELDDRAQDGWEPLLAIADLAGDDWSERARAAARELSGAKEDDSAGVLLLEDIRAVFDDIGVNKIVSAVLIDKLVDLEESPWSEWRGGKPMTTRSLAALLRPYGIRSRSIRVDDDTTRKGFHREQFEDSWNRYLPPSVDLKRHTGTTVYPSGFEADFETAQDTLGAGSKMGSNPHE